MSADTRIEHCYPQARSFLQQHGPDAIAVLHDLITVAEIRDGALVAQASVRQIAGRLQFLSKDTVNRRLRQLIGAGVLHRLPTASTATFETPSYLICLDDSGISVLLVPARTA